MSEHITGQVPPSLGHSTVRALSIFFVSCSLGSSPGSSPSHGAPHLLFPWHHHSPEGEALCGGGQGTELPAGLVHPPLEPGEILGEVGGYQDDLLVAKAAVSCHPLRGLRRFLDPVMWASWSVGTQKSVYVLSWPGGVWACVCLADPVGAVAPGGTWSLCWARASPWGPASRSSFLVAATPMLGPLSVFSHWDGPPRAPGHAAPTTSLCFLGLSGPASRWMFLRLSVRGF